MAIAGKTRGLHVSAKAQQSEYFEYYVFYHIAKPEKIF